MKEKHEITSLMDRTKSVWSSIKMDFTVLARVQ